MPALRPVRPVPPAHLFGFLKEHGVILTQASFYHLRGVSSLRIMKVIEHLSRITAFQTEELAARLRTCSNGSFSFSLAVPTHFSQLEEAFNTPGLPDIQVEAGSLTVALRPLASAAVPVLGRGEAIAQIHVTSRVRDILGRTLAVLVGEDANLAPLMEASRAEALALEGQPLRLGTRLTVDDLQSLVALVSTGGAYNPDYEPLLAILPEMLRGEDFLSFLRCLEREPFGLEVFGYYEGRQIPRPAASFIAEAYERMAAAHRREVEETFAALESGRITAEQFLQHESVRGWSAAGLGEEVLDSYVRSRLEPETYSALRQLARADGQFSRLLDDFVEEVYTAVRDRNLFPGSPLLEMIFSDGEMEWVPTDEVMEACRTHPAYPPARQVLEQYFGVYYREAMGRELGRSRAAASLFRRLQDDFGFSPRLAALLVSDACEADGYLGEARHVLDLAPSVSSDPEIARRAGRIGRALAKEEERRERAVVAAFLAEEGTEMLGEPFALAAVKKYALRHLREDVFNALKKLADAHLLEEFAGRVFEEAAQRTLPSAASVLGAILSDPDRRWQPTQEQMGRIFHAACRQYSPAVKIYQYFVVPLIDRVARARAEGNLEGALEAFFDLARLCPQHEGLWRDVAITAQEHGVGKVSFEMREAMVPLLDQTLSFVPDDFYALQLRMNCAIPKGEWDLMIELGERIERGEDRGHPLNTCRLGHAYYMRHFESETGGRGGAEDLKRAINLFEGSGEAAHAFIDFACLHVAGGNYEEGVAGLVRHFELVAGGGFFSFLCFMQILTGEAGKNPLPAANIKDRIELVCRKLEIGDTVDEDAREKALAVAGRMSEMGLDEAAQIFMDKIRAAGWI